MEKSEYAKNCPSCGKTMYYFNKYKLSRSIENSCKCRSCSKIGNLPTMESRQRMSESHKEHECYKSRIGINHTKDRKEKISKKMLGRKLSSNHIDNISKSLTGRKLSSDHIHNSMVGQEKSKYKRKPYTIGNEVVMIQGYEDLTLNKLISESISIDDIKIKTIEKPRIRYEWNGKIHWYYPDCYLSKSNTIVETKSTWTWKDSIDRNKAKIEASQKEGYNVRVMNWNGKKELVSDTIYR